MEIEVRVEIVNLCYVVRGFTAIKELKEWLDGHASSITQPSEYPEVTPEPDDIEPVTGSPRPEYDLQTHGGV